MSDHPVQTFDPPPSAAPHELAPAVEPVVLEMGGEASRPWWTLSLLVVVLLACLPPLVVVLAERDSTHTMENIALLSAQETWMRQNGTLHVEADPSAWLMPSRNGIPRVTKPPMYVWMSMLGWVDLTPGQADADLITYRARMVAVAMGLLLIVGTFWAGLTLGDRRTAVLAALVAGTTMLLQRQARTASYDIHMAAWLALAMASGLWAMRPFKPRPGWGIWLVGWSMAAVALAAAWLTKGPLALAVFGLPVLAIVAATRDNWKRNLLGFGFSLAVSCLIVLPWYVYAAEEVSRATNIWTNEFRAKRKEFQVPWYYLGLIALVAPWSLWLVGGVCLPWVKNTRLLRRRYLVAWIWFAVVFVFFSIPGAKQQRYILPIIPAAAILIAQVWRFHQMLAETGRVDPGVNVLRWPHWVVLVVASLVVGPFLLLEGWFVEQGWLAEQHLGPINPAWVWISWPLLIGLAIWGLVAHLRWQPMRAALTTGIWMIVLSTVLLRGYAESPSGDHPIRPEAERVMTIVGRQPFYFLKIPGTDQLVNEEFLFYSQRIIPPVFPDELPELTASLAERSYFLASDDELHAELLR